MKYIAISFFVAVTLFANSLYADDNKTSGKTTLTRSDYISNIISGELNTSQTCLSATDKGNIKAFYAARQGHPIWPQGFGNARDDAYKLLESIEQLMSHNGIIVKQSIVNELKSLIKDNNQKPDPLVDANTEVQIVAWLLKAASALRGEMTEWSSFYADWPFHRNLQADLPNKLSMAIEQGRLGAFMEEQTPSSPTYKALLDSLRVWQHYETEGNWPIVSSIGNGGKNTKISIGDRDSRVVVLRQRLSREGYNTTAIGDDEIYDDALVKNMRLFQRLHGLEPDGVVGAKTFLAINATPTQRLAQIRANLERQRSMPDVLPARRAVVNVADASLSIWDEGKIVYRGPVVIGRPDRKTPFISSELRSVIFNPSWNVPDSIAQKDIIPKLRRDPNYLEKMGFSLKSGVDPKTIDWSSSIKLPLKLRQAPGEMNSLGRIKFDFDNDFSVYMHGTPHNELFGRAQRNFSSGCIRLKDPEWLAEFLLSSRGDLWPQERVIGEIAKRTTRWVKVPNPLPLYVVYDTVFADEEGIINFREDVYGRDKALLDWQRKQSQRCEEVAK